MMRHAMRPVRRRIHLLRCGHGAIWGLLGGMAACLALSALSFFFPMEGLWRHLLMIAVAGPSVSALIAFAFPVSMPYAAKKADGCGLAERAQTALAFEDMDTPMSRVQRTDAQTALQAFPVRRAMPFHSTPKIWIPAIACALVSCALLVVPNPQNDIIRAMEQARQSLRAQAKVVEEAAETLEGKNLTEEERRELRRITGEMTREMREAKDAREALANLSEKEMEMEKLQKAIQKRVISQTAVAMGAEPALKGLAEAMNNGNASQMERALAEIADALMNADKTQEIGEALENAAKGSPEGEVAAGLMTSAAAAKAGNGSLASATLTNAIQSADAAGADIASLMKLAKSGTAMAGSRQNQGGGSGMGQGGGTSQSSGMGMGSGAGRGTTQLDMGYAPERASGSQGNGSGPIEDRVGIYERIYDPTRLGGSSDPSLVTGQKGEGESQQAQLGPGQGDLSGLVPYQQVIGEYQNAAAQAVRRQTYPETVQSWVTRYFDALIN